MLAHDRHHAAPLRIHDEACEPAASSAGASPQRSPFRKGQRALVATAHGGYRQTLMTSEEVAILKANCMGLLLCAALCALPSLQRTLSQLALSAIAPQSVALVASSLALLFIVNIASVLFTAAKGIYGGATSPPQQDGGGEGTRDGSSLAVPFMGRPTPPESPLGRPRTLIIDRPHQEPSPASKNRTSSYGVLPHATPMRAATRHGGESAAGSFTPNGSIAGSSFATPSKTAAMRAAGLPFESLYGATPTRRTPSPSPGTASALPSFGRGGRTDPALGEGATQVGHYRQEQGSALRVGSATPQGREPGSPFGGRGGGSSPLPDTGSPKLNAISAGRLPTWTEQLRQTLVSKGAPASSAGQPGPPLASGEGRSADALDRVRADRSGAQGGRRTISEAARKVIPPDASIQHLGLARNLDDIADVLRKWFCTKIIRPLNDSIALVNEEFAKASLVHLSASHPASFSVFSRAAPSLALGSGSALATPFPGGITSTTAGSSQASSARSPAAFILTPTTFAAAAKPQTLFELGQKHPDDPLVQKRLAIERYLSFASLSNQRVAVIRRISEMASDSLALSFRSLLRQNSPPLVNTLTIGSSEGRSDARGSAAGGGAGTPSQLLQGGDSGDGEDAQMLMHLFCVFMDEHLPSEEFNDTQPFSSRYFVPCDEEASSARDIVQIQQTRRQPPSFQLVAQEAIYQAHGGSAVQNVLHVIIFFVEYVHLHYGGFLGIANLASPTIDLVSILNSDYNQ